MPRLLRFFLSSPFCRLSPPSCHGRVRPGPTSASLPASGGLRPDQRVRRRVQPVSAARVRPVLGGIWCSRRRPRSVELIGDKPQFRLLLWCNGMQGECFRIYLEEIGTMFSLFVLRIEVSKPMSEKNHNRSDIQMAKIVAKILGPNAAKNFHHLFRRVLMCTCGVFPPIVSHSVGTWGQAFCVAVILFITQNRSTRSRASHSSCLRHPPKSLLDTPLFQRMHLVAVQGGSLQLRGLK